jgi:hypothetical protein
MLRQLVKGATLALMSDQELRAALTRLKNSTPLRELASRIGLSHAVLYKFLDRQPVRPSTKARIQQWLEEPADDDTAARVRQDLRRLLGRLGAGKRREVEAAIGQVIAEAFAADGQDVPPWVERLGKKQV